MTTALALHDPLGTTIGQMIAPYEAQLAPFLRGGITLERVAAELVLASRKVPHLDHCDPPVLVDAVCRAVATGGIIGRDVHIVPFRDGKSGKYVPTVMTDYRFEAKLVVAAGGARSFYAAAVYDDELEGFQVLGGTDPQIIHRPAIVPKKGRQLVGAYAVAQLGFNHRPVFKWLTLEAIEAVRAKSREYNPTKMARCPEWYACKTAVRQVCKLLPDNPKLRPLLERMQAEEVEELTTPTPLALDIPEDMPATPDPVEEDLGWAFDYILPGKPEAWGGHGGKRLQDIDDPKVLLRVRVWCAGELEKPGGYSHAGQLAQAVNIVLDTIDPLAT